MVARFPDAGDRHAALLLAMTAKDKAHIEHTKRPPNRRALFYRPRLGANGSCAIIGAQILDVYIILTYTIGDNQAERGAHDGYE